MIDETEVYVKNSWKGISFFANSDSKYSRGVAILLKENFDGEVLHGYSSKDGRILLINIEINEVVFTIASVYAPKYSKRACHVL